MARDPRGVPDVVFKQTPYMDFVSAMGAQKRAEADRKIKRQNDLEDKLPEAPDEDFKENFRNAGTNLVNQYTRHRNNIIEQFPSMTKEERQQSMERLNNMRTSIGSYVEDMGNMHKKAKTVKSDIQEFLDEEEIEDVHTWLELNKNTPEGQRLATMLEARDRYTGGPLAGANATFDEDGKGIKLQYAEGVDGPKTYGEYVRAKETYLTPTKDFEGVILETGSSSIGYTKADGSRSKQFNEKQYRGLTDSNLLETENPSGKRLSSYVKYMDEYKDMGAKEALRILKKAQESHKSGKSSVELDIYEEYKDVAVETIRNNMPSTFKEAPEDDKGGFNISFGGGNINELPGSPLNKEESTEVTRGFPVDKYTQWTERMIAYSPDNHIRVSVGKSNFPENIFEEDGKSENEEINKSTLKYVFEGKNGKLYMVAEGLTKSGNSYESNPIELTKERKASLMDGFGVPGEKFDDYFEAKFSKQGGKKQQDNSSQDKRRQGVNKNEGGDASSQEDDSGLIDLT